MKSNMNNFRISLSPIQEEFQWESHNRWISNSHHPISSNTFLKDKTIKTIKIIKTLLLTQWVFNKEMVNKWDSLLLWINNNLQWCFNNKLPCHKCNLQFIPRYSPKMYNQTMILSCPCCKNSVQSLVNHESGNTSVVWFATLLCCVGQCCCLPFMLDDCLDKVHYCPNCGYQILRKHSKCLEFINWDKKNVIYQYEWF